MTAPGNRVDELVPPDREFLLPAEVARIFGVDHKTVGRWIAAGRLSAFKTPGGRWRIHAQPVRDYLASQFAPVTRS